MPIGVHKVGGGSNLWRGRISEFQDSDFLTLNNSGETLWPFKKEELSTHYKKLYKIFNAGEITDSEVIQNYFATESKILSKEFELRSYRFCKLDFFMELFKVIKKIRN